MTSPRTTMLHMAMIEPAERQRLLQLARDAIAAHLSGLPAPAIVPRRSGAPRRRVRHAPQGRRAARLHRPHRAGPAAAARHSGLRRGRRQHRSALSPVTSAELPALTSSCPSWGRSSGSRAPMRSRSAGTVSSSNADGAGACCSRRSPSSGAGTRKHSVADLSQSGSAARRLEDRRDVWRFEAEVFSEGSDQSRGGRSGS